jgi:hypothetical protein
MEVISRVVVGTGFENVRTALKDGKLLSKLPPHPYIPFGAGLGTANG